MELSVTTRQLLETEAARSHSSLRTEAAWRLAAAALALAAAVVMLDILIPLPAWTRGILVLLGPLLFTVHVRQRLATAAQRFRGADSLEVLAARLDRQHPAAESALLTAVQLAGTHRVAQGLAGLLLERVVARAHALSAELLEAQWPASPAPRFRRPVLLAGTAGLLLLVAFPRVARFEAPRFLTFWQDSPPFSLTDFLVTPGSATVKAGADVLVEVRLRGRIPENLELVTEVPGHSRTAISLVGEGEAVYRQRLQGIRDSLVYYVRGETGRSRKYRIVVNDPPEVRTATLRILARAGGKPVREAAIGNLPVQVPRGALVELEVETSRPLREGRLHLNSRKGENRQFRLIPDIHAPQRASARFTVDADAGLRLRLTATDGATNGSALNGQIQVVPDSPPVVAFTEPGANLLVTPAERVRLRADAEDDLALSALVIRYSRNGEPDIPVRTQVAPDRFKAEATLELNLGALSARPGDVIEYEARALDSDVSGAKEGRTARYWIWVVSPEDLVRLRSSNLGGRSAMDAWPEAASHLLEIAQAQQRLAVEAAAKEEGAESEVLSLPQRSLINRAGAVRKEFARIGQSEAQGGLNAGLRKIARQTAQALNAAIRGNMRHAATAVDAAVRNAAMKQAAQELERLAERAQAAQSALRAIRQAAALAAVGDQLGGVAERQSRLADRIGALGHAAGDSRARQEDVLAVEQKANLEQWNQARSTLRQLAEAGAGDAVVTRSARSLLEHVASVRAEEPMSRAATALVGGRLADAAQAALEAQRRLAGLLAQCAKCNQDSVKRALELIASGIGRGLEQAGREAVESLTSSLDGSGMAGAQPAPKPGSRPGKSLAGYGMNGQPVLMAGLQSAASMAGRRSGEEGPGAAQAPEIGQDSVEVAAATNTPKGEGDAFQSDGVRGQYRDLIRAYFRSLAERQVRSR